MKSNLTHDGWLESLSWAFRCRSGDSRRPSNKTGSTTGLLCNFKQRDSPLIETFKINETQVVFEHGTI